ncbi:hypothetical protein HPP92_026176 [Vanilla planifolia]|uniref:Uncharacterized protein n=1 Tax=Vanilla planifolia TaxID=51239 RepID=A0A835PKT4_VANPL|nr:hypothetical protein HPP92_026176 [Vanilla planifolia]
MSGSFLRSGGMISREIICRCRTSLSSGLTGTLPPRPRTYMPSTSAAAKFGRESSHHSPAASTLLSSATAASSAASRLGFVSWYMGMIEKRPVLTKSLTAGAIFAAADISSQMITISDSDTLDWIRTLRMASYGMLVSGPSLHLWFNFASRIFPKRDMVNTLSKMFLGQTMYGPVMTAVFFSLNAALQGETGAEILARLKRDLIPTLMRGLVYWPICDFITFKFISVRLQPLVSNSFAFVWTIYITYMASLQKPYVEQVVVN